jgi:hypothetical protein
MMLDPCVLCVYRSPRDALVYSRYWLASMFPGQRILNYWSKGEYTSLSCAYRI